MFQGTVLGPTLWNLFYEDARRAVHEAAFVDIVQAEELNGFREFEHNAGVDSVMSEAKRLSNRAAEVRESEPGLVRSSEGIRPHRVPRPTTRRLI